MKWIKKYENFITDDNRDTAAIDYLPKHNPVVKQQATEYVDSVLKSNDFAKIFNVIGIQPPKELKGDEMDKVFDEVREKAIEYFVNNPEAIGREVKMDRLPGNKQNLTNDYDRVAKTNNIGGSSQTASNRIGENIQNFDSEIEISEDDMNQFNSSEPLIELIRNNKVKLSNKKVHFNKSDEKTIQTLDIYFEFDQKDLESDIEEETAK
jgi:hypothetical protein